LLDCAADLFARFGFRKTSMYEVARAAGISRQGLYLSFGNKEQLFKRVLAHSMNRQLSAAIEGLLRTENSLEVRLVDACNQWSGRCVGSLGPDIADLLCAGSALAGASIAEYDRQFETALAAVLAASPIAAHCAKAKTEIADLARALHATARGLKQRCKTPDEFTKSMTAAVRFACMPELKL
jgi:AcrR family transcriptional regulator